MRYTIKLISQAETKKPASLGLAGKAGELFLSLIKARIKSETILA